MPRQGRKITDREAEQILALARHASYLFYPNFSRQHRDELIGAAVVGLAEQWDRYDETKMSRRAWAVCKARHFMQDCLRAEARTKGLGRNGNRKFYVVSTERAMGRNQEDGTAISIADTLVGDEDVEVDGAWLTRPLLDAALGSLPDKLRAVMVLYADGLTLVQIGEKLGLGVSEQRVYQLLCAARERLQQDARVRAAADS